MSNTDHEALLRRYVQAVWSEGNVSALDDFLSPEYRRHLSPSAEPLTLDGQKRLLAGFRASFPDIELTVEDVVTEGDRIAFRSTMRGTHEGDFRGIAPTNARVAVGLVDMLRVVDGQIVEQWGGPDVFDLLRQLGATVAPPESPEPAHTHET